MLSQIDILDIIIRHQVYVEFFKNSTSEEHTEFLDWMIAYLSLYFTKKGVERFEDLTKGEINKLIIDFSRKAGQTFGARQASITAQMRKFFNVDFELLKSIFGTFTPRKVNPQPTSKLWAKLMRQPAPGTGEEPKNIIRTFAKSVTTNTVKLIKQGFAEKWTIGEFLRQFTGTKSNNFRDGLLGKFKVQLGAVLDTFVATISSFINHTIGGLIFDEYQWVSVLDSRTTHICRSRDGNVYRYNHGPIPPAHYRCRSSIVPLVEKALKEMPTFSTWVTGQPKSVMDDILGPTFGRRVRTTGATPEEIGKVLRKRKLTLDELSGKRNNILTKNEGTR